MAGVVGATLDVEPKGFGFAGIGAPKVLEGLGVYVGLQWKVGKDGERVGYAEV